MSEAPVMVAPAAYVRIPLFCAITGFSVKAVRRKIEDGVWLERFEYVAANAHVLMCIPGYERWARCESRQCV